MSILNKIIKSDTPEITKEFFLAGTDYWSKEIYELLKDRTEGTFNAKIAKNLKTGYSKYRVMVGKRTVGYLIREAERFYEANKRSITKVEVSFYVPEDFSSFETKVFISAK